MTLMYSPFTAFISSGLSMISSLLILYLYIVHKHLRTLFFNTFVILTSLGAFQFIILVLPIPCFEEGMFMFYILTFNNCITAFIIWLLYAFIRYGKQMEKPSAPKRVISASIENEINNDKTEAGEPEQFESQSKQTNDIIMDQTEKNVPTCVGIKQPKLSNVNECTGPDCSLGNHLSRQLSFKEKLGDIHFELSTMQKVFWYSFIVIIPILLTSVGYMDESYGAWTVCPFCSRNFAHMIAVTYYT